MMPAEVKKAGTMYLVNTRGDGLGEAEDCGAQIEAIPETSLSSLCPQCPQPCSPQAPNSDDGGSAWPVCTVCACSCSCAPGELGNGVYQAAWRGGGKKQTKLQK